MKRVTGIFALLSLVVISASTSGCVALASSAKYSIVDIGGLSKLKSLSIAGVNKHGEIAGSAFIHGGYRVVVDFNNAGLIELPLPHGFKNVIADGINDYGWIAAGAFNTQRRTAAVAAELVPHSCPSGAPPSSCASYVWKRLPAPHPSTSSYSAAGISARGDIAGTIYGANGLPLRAVVWQLSGTWVYAPARALPLSKSNHRSSASSIWSNDKEEIVGGSQAPADGRARGFTLWSRPCSSATDCGPVRSFKPMESMPLQGQLANMWLTMPPITIGGWGRHLYAVGRLMGIDTGSGWVSAVRFTKAGFARPGPIRAVAYPHYSGAECFYGANGVSAGAKGRFAGVGGISCIGAHRSPEAVLWRGDHAINMQKLIAKGTGWKLADAWAINAKGQIVGTGTLNGRTSVFRLSPA